MSSEPKMHEIKPYTLKELCYLYGVSKAIILGWLEPFQEELGVRNGHKYTVKQIALIFERIGAPRVKENKK
jgi:hypothetical protein